MKVWPLRPPLCDISLCQKIKEGKEERRGNVSWGFHPLHIQSGDTGVSLKMVIGTQVPGRANHKLYLPMERGWGTLGKDYLLCESVGTCGSNPWGESHRVRSSDHSGFALSVKRLNRVTYSLCGTSLPLQKNSISCPFPETWTAGSAGRMPAWPIGGIFQSLFCLSDLPNLDDSWYLPATLSVRSSLRQEEQILKVWSTNTLLPSFSVDLGKLPTHVQSLQHSPTPSKSCILRIRWQDSSLPHLQPLGIVWQIELRAGHLEV